MGSEQAPFGAFPHYCPRRVLSLRAPLFRVESTRPLVTRRSLGQRLCFHYFQSARWRWCGFFHKLALKELKVSSKRAPRYRGELRT